MKSVVSAEALTHVTERSIMDYKNSMWGDYSPTPASPQAAVDGSQDTQAMLAGLGEVPGFNNADGQDVDGKPNSAVEGDVGGARPQS